MLRSNAKAAAKQSYFGDDASFTVIPASLLQRLVLGKDWQVSLEQRRFVNHQLCA
jgi:hypothetical protein